MDETQIDTFENVTEANAIFLSRTAKYISTVTVDGKILDPGAYRLRAEGEQIERVATVGDPLRTWGKKVTVVYMPRRPGSV